ncbi:arginine--tRNA ligase, chloroplastic/mitochondrial [Tanacetum coccineum]
MVMQSIGFLGPAFFLSQLSHVDSTAMAVFCMACNKSLTKPSIELHCIQMDNLRFSSANHYDCYLDVVSLDVKFQRPGVQAVISLMAVEIKKHLEKRDDMIKTVSIHDIGFVTFKLSWKWMAKSIHKMLRDGIDSWAPKLYLGKVMINSTSLYNKADVTVFNEYPQKGLGEVAISSNSAVTHPQDGPDFMAEDARLLNYPFPYLYDHVSLSQPLWAAIQPNWT